MSVFGEIGKLVFKTKQGSTLKLNKRGELVDPDTGAAVPYSASEVLDQDSLALYEKFKSGKIGSVNEVLALGTDKAPKQSPLDSLAENSGETVLSLGVNRVGKNNDAYSPAEFMSSAPEMTPEVAAMQVHRGRLGYLAERAGKTPVENEAEVARISQELLALHTKVRAETDPVVKAKLSEKANDLSDYLNDLGLTVEQQTAMLKNSEMQLDAPIYVSRADYGRHNDTSTYSTTIVDPAKLTAQPSVGVELDAPQHNVYKLDKGTKVIHTGNFADQNEVLVPGSALNTAQQANAGTLARSYAKGNPLFSVAGLGLGAAAMTESEDASAMPASVQEQTAVVQPMQEQPTQLSQEQMQTTQPVQEQVVQPAQLPQVDDVMISQQLAKSIEAGQMGYQEAEQVIREMVQNPQEQEVLLAEAKARFAPRPELFKPDMPPEAFVAAVEKINQMPWASLKEMGSLGGLGNAALTADIDAYKAQLQPLIASELAKRGYDTRVAEGQAQYKDKDGEWVNAEAGTLRSLATYGMQTVAGLSAGSAAFRAAGALIPPIGPVGVAAKIGATAIGAGLGGTIGAYVDQLMQAAVLSERLDQQKLLVNAYQDGVADLIFGAGLDTTIKAGSATYKAVVDVTNKAKSAVDNFMLQGALKELENITGLTKAQRQELATKLEEVSENTMARNEARREIEGVLQTRPGMEILVGEASRLSKTAGFGMLKEIDTRAKSVLDATNEMTAGNVSRVVTDELGRYRMSVKKGYEGIKQLGASEAQQAGFRYDPATVIDVPKLIDDAEAGITDPSKLSRLDAFTARIAKIGAESDKEFGLAELLDYRLALKNFKESGQFNYAANQRAERMLADIDKEIAKAVDMMPNGKAWQEQFKQANIEYSKMKALEENVMYKALNKPGASADDTVRALAKYIKAEDGTFMKVMGKLPPHVRNNVEGAVIRNYATKYTAGDEQGFQAIDFPGLARDLDGINFTTKGGQDLKRVVDKLAKVYQNDQALAAEAGAIQMPKNKTYLATSISGRLNMAAHNQLFNYVSRYLPTQQGRTRRLAEAISDVLDNPLNAKSVEKLTRELPGDPNLKTTLQQLSISYAERGQRETYPKVPLYKVYQEGYSQSTKQTKYGDGVEYFTSKEAAEKAKASGQTVEEVLVEPSRYATIDQAGMLLGRELTPEDLKQARVVQDLKKHGFLGIANGDLVFEFK